MKQVKLQIIKKNRIWIECLNSSNYKCKLKVDENSSQLEVGTHELLVEDISIRSKYGVDVRYQLKSQEKAKVFLKHHTYNDLLVKECRELGGLWDSEENVWVFSAALEKEVEELEYIYNSPMLSVEIKALDDIYCGKTSVKFCGYPIAIAKDRDSGAVLGKEVYKISGSIYSCGSMKNWGTGIEKNSIFRLEVPKNLLDKETELESQYFEIKIECKNEINKTIS